MQTTEEWRDATKLLIERNILENAKNLAMKGYAGASDFYSSMIRKGEQPDQGAFIIKLL